MHLFDRLRNLIHVRRALVSRRKQYLKWGTGLVAAGVLVVIWSVATSGPEESAAIQAVTTYVLAVITLAYVVLTYRLVALQERTHIPQVEVKVMRIPPSSDFSFLSVQVTNRSAFTIRPATVGLKKPDGSEGTALGSDTESFDIEELLSPIPTMDSRFGVLFREALEDWPEFPLTEEMVLYVTLSTDEEFVTPPFIPARPEPGY
jgi:hypothetical protein